MADEEIAGSVDSQNVAENMHKEMMDESRLKEDGELPTEADNLKGETERENDEENNLKLDAETDSTEKYDYTTSLMETSIYHDKEIDVDPEIIENLTNGIVQQFLPSLRKTQSTIAQIKDSQQVLIDTVVQENGKFNDCQALPHLESTMAKAKVYHGKLLKLRKEMNVLHDKSAKLKRRAVKLQQQKQKDEMTRAQVMEKEYEREKMLTARVAKEGP